MKSITLLYFEWFPDDRHHHLEGTNWPNAEMMVRALQVLQTVYILTMKDFKLAVKECLICEFEIPKNRTEQDDVNNANDTTDATGHIGGKNVQGVRHSYWYSLI